MSPFPLTLRELPKYVLRENPACSIKGCGRTAHFLFSTDSVTRHQRAAKPSNTAELGGMRLLFHFAACSTSTPIWQQLGSVYNQGDRERRLRERGHRNTQRWGPTTHKTRKKNEVSQWKKTWWYAIGFPLCSSRQCHHPSTAVPIYLVHPTPLLPSTLAASPALTMG